MLWVCPYKLCEVLPVFSKKYLFTGRIFASYIRSKLLFKFSDNSNFPRNLYGPCYIGTFEEIFITKIHFMVEARSNGDFISDFV